MRLDNERLNSVHGPMVTILVPATVAFDDAQDQGRANFAWRYKLTPDEMKIVGYWCQGMGQREVLIHEGIEKNTYYRRREAVLCKVGMDKDAEVIAEAARYGIRTPHT